MIRFDFSELRARIIVLYGTYRDFAVALGISPSTLSNYLQCKRYIPHDTLVRMVQLLLIPDSKVDRYFFRRLES